jgi:hypothetical protein
VEVVSWFTIDPHYYINISNRLCKPLHYEMCGFGLKPGTNCWSNVCAWSWASEIFQDSTNLSLDWSTLFVLFRFSVFLMSSIRTQMRQKSTKPVLSTVTKIRRNLRKEKNIVNPNANNHTNHKKLPEKPRKTDSWLSALIGADSQTRSFLKILNLHWEF